MIGLAACLVTFSMSPIDLDCIFVVVEVLVREHLLQAEVSDLGTFLRQNIVQYMYVCEAK